MIDLKTRLSGDKAVRHDDSRIQEIQSSVITLADITAMRVYIPKFPYSAIDYNPEENYRKSGVDPECESIAELGRGIQSSGLQQSIGLIASELNSQQLHELANHPDAQNPATWETHIGIIFGNRRYLAVTHHTQLSHESVYIYPREALDFVKDIALIENMDRENVDLVEESVALWQQINNRHGGNVAGFARFSGKPISQLNKIYKIGQAAAANEEFQHVIQDCGSQDVIALEYLAKAVLEADTPYRQAQVKKKLDELRQIGGKIVNFRKKAQDLANYAKGESNKKPEWGGAQASPGGDSVSDTDGIENPESSTTPLTQAASDQIQTPAPVAKKKPLDQKAILKKIASVVEALNDVTADDLDDQLRERLSHLKSKLNETGI